MLRYWMRVLSTMMIALVCVIWGVVWLGQFRPDGLMLYSQTNYGGIRLWDMDTNIAYQLLSVDDLGNGAIVIPTWSPNGEEFAFIQRQNSVIDGTVNVADNLYIGDTFGRYFRLLLDNSDIPPLITRTSADPFIIWSPDGQYIALYFDAFGASRLWILSREGQLITQVVSQDPVQEDPTSLPFGAIILWSADSQSVFILTNRNGLGYQQLAVMSSATLTERTVISLPSAIQSIDAIVPSPVSAKTLLYDGATEIVWQVDFALNSVHEVTAINDRNLTALAWSTDGRHIGWVRRSLRETLIHTLSLDDGSITYYELDPRVANDLSFNMWLTSNPLQVFVRMQRGSLCRSHSNMMHCADPNFFAASWFGIRP